MCPLFNFQVINFQILEFPNVRSKCQLFKPPTCQSIAFSIFPEFTFPNTYRAYVPICSTCDILDSPNLVLNIIAYVLELFWVILVENKGSQFGNLANFRTVRTCNEFAENYVDNISWYVLTDLLNYLTEKGTQVVDAFKKLCMRFS